jgi:hypothetical protein
MFVSTWSRRLLDSILAWCSCALARKQAMLLLRNASGSSYISRPASGDARPFADDDAVVLLPGELCACSNNKWILYIHTGDRVLLLMG